MTGTVECPKCGSRVIDTFDDQPKPIRRPIGIEITRLWAVPHDNEFRFKAHDGIRQPPIFINLSSRHWKSIGKALISFSASSRSEYSFKIRSHPHTFPYLNHRPWFVFRVLRSTSIEHNTALQITMNFEKIHNLSRMGERSSLILVEVSAIIRLGKLLIQYSQPRYRLLRWSIKGDIDEVKEPTLGFLPNPNYFGKIEYERDGWHPTDYT